MKNQTFRKKLQTTFLIVGVIPLLILAIYNFIFEVRYSTKSIEKYTESNIKLTANLLDDNMNNFFNIVNFIAQNEEVRKIANKNDEYVDRNERFEDTQKMYTIINGITAAQALKIPIHIVNKNGMSRFSTTNYYKPIYSDERGNFFDTLAKNEGKVVKQIHRRVDGENAQDIVMVIGEAIKNKESGEIIGYVVADIYDSYYDNILNNISFVENSNIYLLDEKGYIITDKLLKNQTGFRFNEEYLKKMNKENGDLSININNVKYKAYYTTSKSNNVKVIQTIPSNYFFTEAFKNIEIFMIIILFVAIIGYVLSRILSNRISKPIHEISLQMKEVELGNRDVYVDFNSNDETGLLVKRFNNMIKEINRLIEEDYKKQILIQQTEFKALKAQINPHFLYNALNSISWMARLGLNNEVEDMTNALSKFFRYSISNTGEIVDVKQEIEQINNYLKIQKNRYRDKLSISIEVSEEILNLKILKLILQPLVENAIIHGLEPKIDSGTLIIKGFIKDGLLIFKIIDDGIGFGQSKHNGEGIGISNVNKRIKIYYGKDYGVTYSNINGLTEALIIIPKDGGVNNDKNHNS